MLVVKIKSKFLNSIWNKKYKNPLPTLLNVSPDITIVS